MRKIIGRLCALHNTMLSILPMFLALLILGSCTQMSVGKELRKSAPLEFDTFLREVNEQRKNVLSEDIPLPDISKFTPDYADELGTFTPAEIDVMLTPHGMEACGLTQETAAKDIETFFQILKTAYGGYYYFGGDDVFLPIRDSVLEDVQNETVLISQTLENILVKHLEPVLVDGHFGVGRHSINEECTKQMYYVPEIYFTEIEDISTDYIKPTIAPDGSIQYCFAALSHNGSDLPKELGGQSLEWKKAENLPIDESVAFLEQEVEGIPLMKSRSMMESSYYPEQKEQLERLSICGAEYREKPLFCFDVRANSGGYSNYSMEWFRGFSGHYPELRGVSAKKNSDLFRESNRRNSENTGNQLPTYPPYGQWSIYESVGSWVGHEGVIFVLLDGGTASAGEEVVQDMETVENVVFVGSNTRGCYTITSNIECYLPHSGLRIYLGQGLHLSGDAINHDGTGKLPDLWVNPTDALDRVTALCKYYKLG